MTESVSWLVGIAENLIQIVLGFFGFWLVWRVLLPWLPGPEPSEERIAPYARYFTDPIVTPIARRTHISPRATATVLLVLTAMAITAVRHIAAALGA